MPSSNSQPSASLSATVQPLDVASEVASEPALGIAVSHPPPVADYDQPSITTAQDSSATQLRIEVSDFGFRFPTVVSLATDTSHPGSASTPGHRTGITHNIPHYRFTELAPRQPTAPHFITSSILQKRSLMYNPYSGGYNAGETSTPPFSNRRKRSKPGPLLVDTYSLRESRANDSTDDSTSDEKMETDGLSPTWQRSASARNRNSQPHLRKPPPLLLHPPTTVLARYRREDVVSHTEPAVPSTTPQQASIDEHVTVSQDPIPVPHESVVHATLPSETTVAHEFHNVQAAAPASTSLASSIPLPPSIMPTPQPIEHILQQTSGQYTTQELPDIQTRTVSGEQPENLPQVDPGSVPGSSIPATISPHIPALISFPTSQEAIAEVTGTATQPGAFSDVGTTDNTGSSKKAHEPDVVMQDGSSKPRNDVSARASSSSKGKERAAPSYSAHPEQLHNLKQQIVDELGQSLENSVTGLRDELRAEMQTSMTTLRKEVTSGIADIQRILNSLNVAENPAAPSAGPARDASPSWREEAGGRQPPESLQSSDDQIMSAAQAHPQAPVSFARESEVTPQPDLANMPNTLRRSASPLLRGRSVSPSPSPRARSIAARSSPAISHAALRYFPPSSHRPRESNDDRQASRVDAGPSINITPPTAGFVSTDPAWPSSQDRLYVPVSHLRYQQAVPAQNLSDRVPMPGGMSPPSPAHGQASSRRSSSEPPSPSFPTAQPDDVNMSDQEEPSGRPHSPTISHFSSSSDQQSTVPPTNTNPSNSRRSFRQSSGPQGTTNATQESSTLGRDMRRRRYSNPARENFLTNHRRPWDVTLAEDIREHFRLLMNRESSTAGFDLDLVPEPWEIRAFDPALGRACTAARFRPDLNGTPRSAWNKSCFPVFLQSFLAMERKYTREHEHAIEKAFFGHLRYLQSQWEDADKNLDTLRARQLTRNRRSRKRALLDRRIRAALSHPDTQEDARMLHRMGTDCTSSDESGGENGAPIFKIKILPWRNPEVTIWLRGFDALYRAERYGPIMHNSKGAPPRERVESGLVSHDRRIPRGLPANAYARSVVDALPSWHREDLAEAPPYNFTHSATIRHPQPPSCVSQLERLAITMKVVFHDHQIRFKAPTLLLGEVHDYRSVNAEIVIVEVDPRRYLIVIAGRSGPYETMYIKLFNEKWQFVADQSRFSLKWGVDIAPEHSDIQNMPEVEFLDQDTWWKGMKCFLELREKAARQATVDNEARRSFYQHLDDTFR